MTGAERKSASPEASARWLAAADEAVACARALIDGADPDLPSDAGWMAIALLREAATLALAAQGLRAPTGSLGDALGGGTPPGMDELWALLQIPVERRALKAPSVSRRDALLVEARIRALLDEAHARAPAPAPSRLRRLAWLAPALFVAALAGWMAWRPTDLARGRPFRASSHFASYPEQGRVDVRGPGELLFHTREEESPWVELDLGEPRAFSRVEVRNRTDCCGQRALPLVVEVRSGDEPWLRVARRDRPFVTWTAELEPTSARFVRLRALGKTLLHLEGIIIR